MSEIDEIFAAKSTSKFNKLPVSSSPSLPEKKLKKSRKRKRPIDLTESKTHQPPQVIVDPSVEGTQNEKRRRKENKIKTSPPVTKKGAGSDGDESKFNDSRGLSSR